MKGRHLREHAIKFPHLMLRLLRIRYNKNCTTSHNNDRTKTASNFIMWDGKLFIQCINVLLLNIFCSLRITLYINICPLLNQKLPYGREWDLSLPFCSSEIELIPGTKQALSRNLCIDCWQRVRTSQAENLSNTFPKRSMAAAAAAATPAPEENFPRKSLWA